VCCLRPLPSCEPPQAFQEWSPVIDGVELTDYPRKLMAEGEEERGGGGGTRGR
jgi:hypothetical protein